MYFTRAFFLYGWLSFCLQFCSYFAMYVAIPSVLQLCVSPCRYFVLALFLSLFLLAFGIYFVRSVCICLRVRQLLMVSLYFFSSFSRQFVRPSVRSFVRYVVRYSVRYSFLYLFISQPPCISLRVIGGTLFRSLFSSFKCVLLYSVGCQLCIGGSLVLYMVRSSLFMPFIRQFGCLYLLRQFGRCLFLSFYISLCMQFGRFVCFVIQVGPSFFSYVVRYVFRFLM